MRQWPGIVVVLSGLAISACESNGSGTRSGSGGTNGGSAGAGGSAGGGRDPATVPVPDPISESDFKSLYAEFACDALAPCCAPAGYQYNAASCQLVLTSFAREPNPNITFDSSSAVACLRALQSNPLACGSGMSATCRAAYLGTQASGAACQESDECSPAGDLVVECDSTDQVCTTTSKGKLGDLCDENCLTDAESPSRSAMCLTTFMAKPYPVSPYAHVACDRAQGLFCETWTNKCAAVKGAGESCTGPTDCAVGMNCIVSGTTGTCQARPPVGQPCSNSSDLVQCTFDAYCASDQICRARKVAGQSCSTSDECMGLCLSGLCLGSSPTEALSNALTGLACGGQKL